MEKSFSLPLSLDYIILSFFTLFHPPALLSFFFPFSLLIPRGAIKEHKVAGLVTLESCPGMQNELLLVTQAEPLTTASPGTVYNQQRLLETPEGSSDDVKRCQVFLHDGEQRRREEMG